MQGWLLPLQQPKRNCYVVVVVIQVGLIMEANRMIEWHISSLSVKFNCQFKLSYVYLFQADWKLLKEKTAFVDVVVWVKKGLSKVTSKKRIENESKVFKSFIFRPSEAGWARSRNQGSKYSGERNIKPLAIDQVLWLLNFTLGHK